MAGDLRRRRVRDLRAAGADAGRHAMSMIPKSGSRFSEKIMLN
jgi:hypothetical protein